MLQKTISGVVGFDDDSRLILVDNGQPFDEPPSFDNNEQRKGAIKAAEWILELIGPLGTAAKLAGLRCAFKMESKSLQEVADQLGCGRACISKFRTLFCDRFGLPAGRTKRQRDERAQITANNWKKRKNGAANNHHDGGRNGTKS